MGTAMTLDIRTADDVAIVTLEGTIDSRTAVADRAGHTLPRRR